MLDKLTSPLTPVSKQIKGKKFLMKFKFDSFTDGMDLRSTCRSLDKYLSPDAWTNLYKKLGKSIDRYVGNETEMPSKELIAMRRFQLELDVSWQKCDSIHLDMFGIHADKAYAYMMVVRVRAVTKTIEHGDSRSVNAKHNVPTKSNDSTPNETNRQHSVATESLGMPTAPSENTDALAPAGEFFETVNEIDLDLDLVDDEAAAADGSLDLISVLPIAAIPLNDPDDSKEFDRVDAYEARQSDISQSHSEGISHFSDGRKLSWDSENKHEAMALYGDRSEMEREHTDGRMSASYSINEAHAPFTFEPLV